MRPPTRRSSKAPSNQRPEVSRRASAGRVRLALETKPAPCRPAALVIPAKAACSRRSPRPSSTNSAAKTKPALSEEARSAMVCRLPVRAIPKSSSQRMRISAFAAASIARDGSAYFKRSAFQNTTRAAAPSVTGCGGSRSSTACSASSVAKAVSKLDASTGASRIAWRAAAVGAARFWTMRATITRRDPR